jgi:hypothetical protein
MCPTYILHVASTLKPSHLHSIVILVQHLPLPRIMSTPTEYPSQCVKVIGPLAITIKANKPSCLVSNTLAGGQEGMKTPPSSQIPLPDVAPQLDLAQQLDRGQGIDTPLNEPVPGNLYPTGIPSTFMCFDDLLHVSAIGWHPFFLRLTTFP